MHFWDVRSTHVRRTLPVQRAYLLTYMYGTYPPFQELPETICAGAHMRSISNTRTLLYCCLEIRQGMLVLCAIPTRVWY